MDLHEPLTLNSAKHINLSAHHQTITSTSCLPFPSFLLFTLSQAAATTISSLTACTTLKKNPRQRNVTTKLCHSVAISFFFSRHKFWGWGGIRMQWQLCRAAGGWLSTSWWVCLCLFVALRTDQAHISPKPLKAQTLWHTAKSNDLYLIWNHRTNRSNARDFCPHAVTDTIFWTAITCPKIDILLVAAQKAAPFNSCYSAISVLSLMFSFVRKKSQKLK